MASPYGKSGSGSGSRGSSGGSAYGKSGRGSAPATTKPKQKGKSVGGFFGNLGGGIAEAATGVFPGLIKTGGAIYRDANRDAERLLTWTPWSDTPAPFTESEVYSDILRPVAGSYKRTYGPLAPGGRPASDFLDEFYGKPVGPLLDLATLASFGVGGSLKATGVLSKTQRLDHTVNAKTYSRDTNVKGKGLDWTLKKIDAANERLPLAHRLPRFEIARFSAELKRLPRKEAADLQLQIRGYNRAVRLFDGRKFEALHFLGKGVDPRDYADYLIGKGVAPKLTARYRDPKLLKLYDAPTPKLLKAADEARKLSEVGESIFGKLGWLDEAAAAERPYLTARLVSGAEFKPDIEAITKKADAARNGWWPGAAEEAARLDEFLSSYASVTDNNMFTELDALAMERHVAARPRPAAGTDPPTVEKLSRQLKTTKGPPGITIETSYLHGLQAEFPAGKLVVMRGADGEPVGILSISLEIPADAAAAAIGNAARFAYGKAELLEVAVKPGHQRQGIATKLFQVARDAGYDVEAASGLGGLTEAGASLQFARRSRMAASTGITGGLAPGTLVKAADRGNFGRIVAIEGDTAQVHFVNRAEGSEATVSLPLDSLSPVSGAELAAKLNLPTSLQGGKALDAIRRDLADAGRPEPFYIPDRAVRQRPRNPDLRRQGGGKAAPKKLGTSKQNKGVLTDMGMLALNSDLLGPEYLNRIKASYHGDLHGRLLEAGRPVKVREGEGLRDGEVWLRRRNERIPYTEQIRGENERQLLEGIEGPGKRHFIADDADSIHTLENGDRIAIPEQLAQSVGGEFTRSERALRWFWENPTKVWRHLVLGLRVGFLVNNLVGNHLLYAIKFGGPSGLRAYANMIYNTHGADFTRRMLGTTRHDRGWGRDIHEAYFPEQSSQATFGAQNAIVGRPGATRARRAAMVNLLPLTQALAEGGLRRASTETALRRAPEVKAALRQLPGQQREILARLPPRAVAMLPKLVRERKSFETAARIALDKNPALEQRISRQVNDALGDYLSLSALERNGLRAVFPFYSWYKAITRITVKLALDNPLRADILAQLAAVQGDFTEGLGPDNQGLVPTPGLDRLLGGSPGAGTTTVLNTTGLNPFATIPQIGSAAGAVVGANDRPVGQTLGQNIHPFAQSLIEFFSERDLYTGYPKSRSAGGLLSNVYGAVAAELPQKRLVSPLEPSTVQPQRDRRSTFLAFLGVPVRRVDLERLRDYERER